MTTSSSALSAAESVSFAPHAEQNCALFFCSLPHFGQILGMVYTSFKALAAARGSSHFLQILSQSC
jgi:L-asparaginase II